MYARVSVTPVSHGGHLSASFFGSLVRLADVRANERYPLFSCRVFPQLLLDMASSSRSAPGINLRRQVIVESHSPEPHDDHQQEHNHQNETMCGSHCSLRASTLIILNSTAHTAFFKLQSNLSLLLPSSLDPIRSNIYLIIKPEQVQSLVWESRDQLPASLAPVYKKLAGRKVIRLAFTLSEPPALVVPNISSLMPKSRDDASLLHAYQLLAGRRTVTVYLPAEALSEAQVSSLCAAVSAAGPAGRRVATSREHARVQDWYQGFAPGGQTVTADEMSRLVSSDAPTASLSPPSYDELALSPPHTSAPPQKRSRVASSGSSVGPRPLPVAEADVLANRLHHLILEAGKQEALLKERIDAADARLEQLPQLDRLGKEDVMQCLDERLDSLRDELCDFIDDRCNDLFVDHVLREEMEQFVDEAIAAAQEDIRDKLEGGVSVRFLD